MCENWEWLRAVVTLVVSATRHLLELALPERDPRSMQWSASGLWIGAPFCGMKRWWRY